MPILEETINRKRADTISQPNQVINISATVMYSVSAGIDRNENPASANHIICFCYSYHGPLDLLKYTKQNTLCNASTQDLDLSFALPPCLMAETNKIGRLWAYLPARCLVWSTAVMGLDMYACPTTTTISSSSLSSKPSPLCLDVLYCGVLTFHWLWCESPGRDVIKAVFGAVGSEVAVEWAVFGDGRKSQGRIAELIHSIAL